jgi:hypothetical protein
VHTILIGPHAILKVYPNSLLVAKFSNEQQQIVSYNIPDISGAQSTSDELNVLWQAADSSPTTSKIILTATLPLEFEVIIQGYCTISQPLLSVTKLIIWFQLMVFCAAFH